MAAGAAMLKVGGMAGPAMQFERGLSTPKISPRFEIEGLQLAPATFNRTPFTHRVAAKKPFIRAQANSRDASSPGSTPPGEIKKTVEREVGVSAGKSSPGSPGAPIESPMDKLQEQMAQNQAKKAKEVSEAVKGTTSYAAAVENLPHEGPQLAEHMAQNQAKKVKEVSEAVKGTTSYAAVAENLRHEGPKPGPIRSEVLERASDKQQERLEERAQDRAKTDERPFKEPRQDETLNLKTQSGRRFSFKALAAIVAILFIAFGFAPVWSPIVGKVLTPFFQLVGVAVAVKFFVTDFLRADKRKELYKKGEQFKEDVTGS